MNSARQLSPDTQNLTPAEHAKALGIALLTLEAMHATAEARGDWAAAEVLEPMINDIADEHLCALITSTGGKVHEMPPEFRLVNATGGEA